MKKASLFLVVIFLLALLYFSSVALNILSALGCVDANQEIYFIENRVTGNCKYTYTCSGSPLGHNSGLLYKKGCEESSALVSLLSMKQEKYQNEIKMGIASCKDYGRPFTANPKLSCQVILENQSDFVESRVKVVSIEIDTVGPGMRDNLRIYPGYIEYNKNPDSPDNQSIIKEPITAEEFENLQKAYEDNELWKYSGEYSQLVEGYPEVVGVTDYLIQIEGSAPTEFSCTNGCPESVAFFDQKVTALVLAHGLYAK